MNKIKNDLYNDFWEWLDSASIKYKNYEIKNAIIAHKYSQLSQIAWDRKGFNLRKFLSSIKWKIKLNLLMGKVLNQNMILKRNHDLTYDLSNKNLYAINFSPKDSRHFLHIAPLAENDKNSLVITVRDDVYEYFNKLGIQSILLDIYNPWRKIKDLKIQIPKVQPSKILLFSLDIFSLILISRAASLIDLLDILKNKKGLPRVLITLQDFHAFDSVFATYFTGKVPTITLQHGKATISKRRQNNLWKYLISDWMIVFGSNQAEILRFSGVDSKKIKILGTAKYDLYADNMKGKLKLLNNKNRRILLSIPQAAFSKENREAIFNFVKILLTSKEDYTLSVRFHLGVLKRKRKQFIQRLKKMIKLSNVVFEVSKIEDPLEDISKSMVILTFITTLAIEAIMLEKPVIEYLLSKKDDSKEFRDYRDFVLYACTGEEAKILITELLNNNDFCKEVIEKQNKFVNSEIMSPPAIPRILEFINSFYNNKRSVKNNQ